MALPKACGVRAVAGDGAVFSERLCVQGRANDWESWARVAAEWATAAVAAELRRSGRPTAAVAAERVTVAVAAARALRRVCNKLRFHR